MHEWDSMTAWCVKCGCSLLDAQDRKRPVCSSENVIAISHILARKHMDKIVKEVLGVSGS